MPGTDSERKDEVSHTAALPRVSMFDVRDRMTAVVDAAMRGEPTVITRYKSDSVVVVDFKEFERLLDVERQLLQRAATAA